VMSGGSVTAGSLLDRRYRIDAQIARGGMSTVYRALDTRLDRPVAVKIMDPKFAEDPQFVARFEFEARAVARLNNPGLVAVYDHGRDRDGGGAAPPCASTGRHRRGDEHRAGFRGAAVDAEPLLR